LKNRSKNENPRRYKKIGWGRLLTHRILSQIELGIEPVFWQNEADAGERPDVLPLTRPG
jgi:hypothetical protein